MSEKKPLPVMRTNREDIDLIFGLFAGMQELMNVEEKMEKRVRSIPNGWRDLKMLISVFDKLIKSLIETVPVEKCMSMNRMLPRMKFKIICGAQPSNLGDDECLISNHDANVLATHAHEHCKMCFDQDCRRCALGKTLDSVMTYDRDDRSWANIDLASMLEGD